MPLHVSSTCAHHQEVKFFYTASGIITHIGGRPVHRLREDWMECISQPVHRTATYSSDDARGCRVQF